MRLEELSADENSGVYFTSRSGGAGNAMQIISGMIRIIMTCFAVIVSIISLLNIFNSVSALHAQRSKMNAALESIGMTRKQLRSVYARETAGMILKSIMISLTVILALSWLIRTLMMSRFGDFSVRVPYLLLCSVMLAAILSVFAIQQLSFRLSSKSSLIEQIRSEAR
jgi:putative ABC transport system permease protein